MAAADITAVALTDAVASVAALFMPPMEVGINPLANPIQYKVPPKKTSLRLRLTRFTVAIIDVFNTTAARMYDTKGR